MPEYPERLPLQIPQWFSYLYRKIPCASPTKGCIYFPFDITYIYILLFFTSNKQDLFQLTFPCLLYRHLPAFADVCFLSDFDQSFFLCKKPVNTNVYGLSQAPFLWRFAPPSAAGCAPRVGLEPTTTRLTAECSTIDWYTTVKIQGRNTRFSCIDLLCWCLLP